jgi:hypothetical protein
MGLLLTVILAVCLVASLLPLLFPGAGIGLLGLLLNQALAPLLAEIPAIGPRLVVGSGAARTLTLEGVVVAYGPVLLVLLWGQRRR